MYEPENVAFGGPEDMDIAHAVPLGQPRHPHLFRTPCHWRAELSVLLLSALFRAAGQDRYEQGDVWHRVTLMRPPLDTTPPRLAERAAAVRLLDFADPAALTGPGQALACAADRMAAFTAAGAALRAAHSRELLARGLRNVLAHHVIFTWNRAGVPAPMQTLLADAARHTLLDLPPCTSMPPDEDGQHR
jgi:thiopeptide-type bacteriocin biosynthesis protein